MTLSLIPGGIGIFRYSHAVWGTVGMMYGVKYDSLSVPRSSSSNAIAFWFSHMTWLNNSTSCGHKKPVEFISSFAKRSWFIRGVSTKGGHTLANFGNESSGSIGILQCTRASSGNVPETGLTFWSTLL